MKRSRMMLTERSAVYEVNSSSTLSPRMRRTRRIEQRGPLRAPQQLVAEVVDAGVGQHDVAVDLVVDHLVAVAREQPLAMAEADLHRQVVHRVAAHAHLEADLEAFDPRRPAHLVDVGPRHPLEPHGLPDAGGARVPDRVRLALPVLLAARLGELMRIVLGAHRDDLPARGVQHVRDVGRERGVPAFVGRHQMAVDPHLGAHSRPRRSAGSRGPCPA